MAESIADGEWFGTAEAELDHALHKFLAILRARAEDWTTAKPQNSYALAGSDTANGNLLVCLDIDDDEMKCSMVTLGAYVDGGVARGDELHQQSLALPAQATDNALFATGSPEQLGTAVANWYEQVLRRPIVRHEWVSKTTVAARAWLFADTLRVLVLQGRHSRDRLGAPDRIVHVRGTADH